LYRRPRVFVCLRTSAPFHWFKCYAYFKLGISAQCQFGTRCDMWEIIKKLILSL